jgi:hypothetical protein
MLGKAGTMTKYVGLMIWLATLFMAVLFITTTVRAHPG